MAGDRKAWYNDGQGEDAFECEDGGVGVVKSYSSRGPWLLVVFLVIGGVAGSLVDNLLVPTVPALRNIFSLALRPGTLDLHFLSITLGLSLAVGPLTVVGLILGYIVYRRS